MDDIDEKLRRTARSVDRYGVPERIIGVAADCLTSMPDRQRHMSEADAMHDALLHVADMHAGPHEGCPTCHAVANGLAVALGVVRAEVNADFERRIG